MVGRPSILVGFSWHAEAVHQRAEILGPALGAADPAGVGGGVPATGVVDPRVGCWAASLHVSPHDGRSTRKKPCFVFRVSCFVTRKPQRTKDGPIDRAAPIRRAVRTHDAKKRFRLSTEPLVKIAYECSRGRFSRQTRSAGTNRTRPPPTLAGRNRANAARPSSPGRCRWRRR